MPKAEDVLVSRLAEILSSTENSPELHEQFDDRRRRLGLLADLLDQARSLVGVDPRALAALIRSTAGVTRNWRKNNQKSERTPTAREVEDLLGRAFAHKRPSMGDVIRTQNLALDGLAALVESAGTVEQISPPVLASSIRRLAELEPRG